MKNTPSGRPAVARRDLFAEVTNKIISALEKGCAPWVKPWSETRGTRETPVSARDRGYRGINRIILTMAQCVSGYPTAQWFTRKMAIEAGGHIRKGEKGTAIVFFRPIDLKPAESAESDPDDRNEAARRIWIHRCYYVWNRAQLVGVDGIPMPQIPSLGSTAYRHALSDRLVDGSGAEIHFGGNRAYYAPGGDFIRVPNPPQFANVGSFHATRFHGLVHWTGHGSRLARKYGMAFGDPDYAREELVAEMGAAFLCEWTGLAAELQHPEYIASWLEVLKADSAAVIVAATQAQKAVDFLMEKAGQEDLREAA